MAFTPPTYTGAFNVGTDRSIRIVRNDTGQTIALGGRTASIDWSAKDTVDENDGIDNGGRVDHRTIPGGITGSINLTRYNGDFENFMKVLDANYYSGSGQIYCTMVVTTVNQNNQKEDVDTFTLAVFHGLKSDASGKAKIRTSIQFSAQERL